MPSPTRWFNSDPNKKGRGRGVYYLRGDGYYSKYSIERDRVKKSKGYKKSKVGIDRQGKKKGSTIRHTGDGILPR